MVRVEKNLKDNLVATTLHWTGTSLTRAECPKGSIWLGPEHFRDGAALNQFFWWFQCLTTLTVKNFYLISNTNLSSFSLKLLPISTFSDQVSSHHSCRLPLDTGGNYLPWSAECSFDAVRMLLIKCSILLALRKFKRRVV